MGGNGNGEGKKAAGLGAATKQAGSKPTGQRAQSGGAPPHPARRSPAAEPAATTTQPGPGGGPFGGGRAGRADGRAARPGGPGGFRPRGRSGQQGPHTTAGRGAGRIGRGAPPTWDGCPPVAGGGPRPRPPAAMGSGRAARVPPLWGGRGPGRLTAPRCPAGPDGAYQLPGPPWLPCLTGWDTIT